MMDRRRFLKLSGAMTLAAAAPRLAFAAAPTDDRLVFVVLRGGLDGLHAVAPYADSDYRRLRPTLALGAPGQENGVLDLDGSFGLHPMLAPLQPLYANGELLVIPAATTRYRARSHFDGQNLLENGSGVPFGARDGWLNRAIASLHRGDDRLGLALGPAVPLLLQGKADVATWADSPLPKADADFLSRLAYAYHGDELFADTLAKAQGSMAPAVGSSPSTSRRGGRQRRNEEFEAASRAAAGLLARDDGPRIAVMESGGWDTHFGQDRRLDALFGQLSAGLIALRDGLGAHWRNTVVIVVSEFGRTAAENGSQGTDHGVGGIAFLAGGPVNGGRVGGQWPGLRKSALYEGRDVRPTTDYESLFKAVLIERLALSPTTVEDTIFPDSRAIAPAEGLFRDTTDVSITM
jgi:uncharacterized protein (DUF1501 family)